MFQSKLPIIFWTYAVCHTIFIINRLPTPVLGNKTPFKMLYAKPPTFLDFKVFGCLAYATTLIQNRGKLDSRAKKCIFLGYKPSTKGYYYLNLSTQSVFINRHAVFYENIFPYLTYSAHPNTDFVNPASINDIDDPLSIIYDSPSSMTQPPHSTQSHHIYNGHHTNIDIDQLFPLCRNLMLLLNLGDPLE